MDLRDKINEITANSVTPEEFKKATGYSIDEHVAKMMDRIHELEGTKDAELRPIKSVTNRRAAAKRAALSAAAKKTAAHAIEHRRKIPARLTKDYNAIVKKAVKDAEKMLKAANGRKKRLTAQELKKGIVPVIKIGNVAAKRTSKIIEPVKGPDVITFNIKEVLVEPTLAAKSGKKQARKVKKGGEPDGGGPK